MLPHEQASINAYLRTVPGWLLWLGWIIVSLVAWVSAILVNQLLKESVIALFSLASLIVGGAVGAAILSIGQWLFLRPIIRSPGWWMAGSTLAGALGVIAGIIIGAGVTIFSILVVSSVTPYEAPTGPDRRPQPLFGSINLVLALGGLVGGAVVGNVQRLLFRRPIQYRGWWIVAWSIGAAAGNFLLLPAVFGPVVNGLISGLAFGLLSAPALAVLRRNFGAHRIETQLPSA
jgi:hypothetical protein